MRTTSAIDQAITAGWIKPQTTLARVSPEFTAPEGWEDYSKWSPSTIRHHFTLTRDRLLATITVSTQGIIKWSVVAPDGDARSQRGPATSIENALASCMNTMGEVTGTLF